MLYPIFKLFSRLFFFSADQIFSSFAFSVSLLLATQKKIFFFSEYRLPFPSPLYFSSTKNLISGFPLLHKTDIFLIQIFFLQENLPPQCLCNCMLKPFCAVSWVCCAFGNILNHSTSGLTSERETQS